MARKSKVETEIKKEIKNTHFLTIVIVLIVFVVGALGGWFGYSLISKNDTFELLGEKEITLSLHDTYVESGAKVVAFGKDVSKDVKIEGDVNTSQVGTYYITYTINNFKFNNVKKVRVVNVV